MVAKRQSRPIKASGVAVGGEEEGSLKERASQEQSTEDDLRGFLMATAPPKSVRNRNARRDCKDDNYLHYAPPDVYSEKGSVCVSREHGTWSLVELQVYPEVNSQCFSLLPSLSLY